MMEGWQYDSEIAAIRSQESLRNIRRAATMPGWMKTSRRCVGGLEGADTDTHRDKSRLRPMVQNMM